MTSMLRDKDELDLAGGELHTRSFNLVGVGWQ
jgi:hypothetical protein